MALTCHVYYLSNVRSHINENCRDHYIAVKGTKCPNYPVTFHFKKRRGYLFGFTYKSPKFRFWETALKSPLSSFNPHPYLPRRFYPPKARRTYINMSEDQFDSFSIY